MTDGRPASPDAYDGQADEPHANTDDDVIEINPEIHPTAIDEDDGDETGHDDDDHPASRSS